MKLALPTYLMPSQSKFIAKYFPYKKSEILLFEDLYGMRVTTMAENCHVQLRIPHQLLTLFFIMGVTVLTSTSCCSDTQ